MSNSTQDLGKLFGTALQALTANKDQINQLDGFNGNHGDNIVSTLSLITQGLQNNQSKPPAEALQNAASLVQTQGQGGSSRYYAQGLQQAAAKVQGQDNLSDNDVMGLLQNILGAVPAQGGGEGGSVMEVLSGLAGGHKAAPAQPPPQADGNDLLGSLMGMVTGQEAPPAAQPQPQAGGNDLLGSLMGMVTGQNAQPTAQPANAPGLDMNDLMNAGMAFLQATQSGADTKSALTQAAMSGLLGVNPMQAGSPRAAAGGVLAQSVLQALMSRR
jgi:hypothetical protein